MVSRPSSNRSLPPETQLTGQSEGQSKIIKISDLGIKYHLGGTTLLHMWREAGFQMGHLGRLAYQPRNR